MRLKWLREFWEWLTAPEPSYVEHGWQGVVLRLREIERKERQKRERRMFELARKL